MAEYIQDDGSYGVDAELSGSYTTTSDVVTMSATGSADTGITLSQTLPFILVETYDLDTISGALSFHFWTDNVDDVATYIAACQTKVEAEVTASNFTTYDMKATYFDGTDANVFLGDEATSFPGTANYTKVNWAPPTGTWKITDTLVAPAPWGWAIVSLGAVGSASTGGYTYNDFIAIDSMDTETTLVDIDNNTITGASVECTTNAEANYTDDGGLSGDDACAESYLRYGMWYALSGASDEFVIALKLPAGTYNIVFHCNNQGDTLLNDINFDGNDFTIDSEGATTNCHEISGVVYTGTAKDITVSVNGSEPFVILNGIVIERTA